MKTKKSVDLIMTVEIFFFHHSIYDCRLERTETFFFKFLLVSFEKYHHPTKTKWLFMKNYHQLWQWWINVIFIIVVKNVLVFVQVLVLNLYVFFDIKCWLNEFHPFFFFFVILTIGLLWITGTSMAKWTTIINRSWKSKCITSKIRCYHTRIIRSIIHT